MPEGKKCTSFVEDFFRYSADTELNRWTERGVFCVLLGAERDWDEVRRIGRNWLGKGKQCAEPDGIADLR